LRFFIESQPILLYGTLITTPRIQGNKLKRISSRGRRNYVCTTCPVLGTSNNNHQQRLTQHYITLPAYICAKAHCQITAI